MLSKILDFIFPPKCPFCGEILRGKAPVCDKCMASLPFIDGDVCECCGKPIEEFSYRLCSQCNNDKRYFKHSFVPLIYEDDAKKAILRLKHHSHPYYAKAFAFLLADKILSSDKFVSFDYITCVPLDKKGERNRGYNQSELIAKELAVILGVPFERTLLRTSGGEKQATLSAEERRKNVRKCYFSGEKTFSGETVLLIDDVYTTGETTNYCSKLLHKIGFGEVYLGVATIRCSD